MFLIIINVTVDSYHHTHQDTKWTNHLTNFKAGWCNRFKKVFVLFWVCTFKVCKVSNPGKPEWVLTQYFSTFSGTSQYVVSTTQLSVVNWDSQHVVETKWQEKTFQSTEQERCQDWSSFFWVGNPHTEAVDSWLDNWPYDSKDDSCDSWTKNNYEWYEAFTIEEWQSFWQFTEVIVFVEGSSSDETRDDTYEHTHVEGWSFHNTDEVIRYLDWLTKNGVDCSSLISKNIWSNTKDWTSQTVNQDKGKTCRKGTACTFLSPATTNGKGEQDVKVTNNPPTNLLKKSTSNNEWCHVWINHGNRFTDRDHETCCWHNRDNNHEGFTEFLPELKAKFFF